MVDEHAAINNHREYRHSQVLAALEEVGLSDGLRGSWLHGDFHLSAKGDSSASDLDLVASGASVDQCVCFAQQVRTYLHDIKNLRVSVHPNDSLGQLDLIDARFLVIGECLSNLLYRVPRGLVTADYIRAKGSLLVLRESLDERYAAVAARLGSPEARLAWQVKLGVAESFSVQSCHGLLHRSGIAVAIELAEHCLCTPTITQTYVDDVVVRLQQVSTITPWLQHHLILKLQGA